MEVDSCTTGGPSFREDPSSFWEGLFQVASYLTDPPCLAHEAYRKSQIVEYAYATASKVERLARKVFHCSAAAMFGALAIFSSLPGIALRAAATALQPTPYLQEKVGIGRELPEERAFSLLSWNVCCVAGGYTLTDGGVAPWRERIDRIIQKIIDQNADVNCLYELFDFHAADYVKIKLLEAGYTHIYYNIGPMALGVSSGILVASKFKMENPEFTPFPKETLVGRTQFANKGVFEFDLVSQKRPFAHIFATHLQHSELPEFPTPEEVKGRLSQMQVILDKIAKVRDRCLLLTGDLNLDDAEYKDSSWKDRFVKGDRFTQKTWGGDAFCKTLVGEPISRALNLDHTLLVQGTAQNLQTHLIDTGYCASEYRPDALSDHEGLYSCITL